MEFALFLTLPAAAALILISKPILHTVFEHGAFTRADTMNVAPALAAFALGLPAFTLTKIFQPGFFAREDTKTPMYFAITAVVINIVASLVLTRYFGHVGIALATSIAAWCNAGALIVTTYRRKYFSADKRFKSRLPRMIASILVMTAVLYGLSVYFDSNFAENAGFTKALQGFGIMLAAGIGSYFIAAQVTGAFRFSELKSAMRR